jgi:hypothetical protein
MRTLCVLFVLTTANVTFAQKPAEPSGAINRLLLSGSEAAKVLQVKGLTLFPGVPPKTPRVNGFTPFPQGLAATVAPVETMRTECSVPLLEMQIPNDIHFTMQQVTPRTDNLAPMPQAKGLPPCESSSLR